MYELTFENILVQQNDANWARALFDANIDFNGPSSSFWFAVYDPTVSETSYRIGHITIETKMLITLLQQSAIGELSLMAGEDVGIEPTGVYDCKTAQYMSIIAAYIRQTAVTSEAWRVTPTDVLFLLSRNTFFQTSVNDALRKAGYEGASGQNGIPLIYQDWAKFSAPKIPSDCGFKTVGGGADAAPPPAGLENVGAMSDAQPSKFPTLIVGAAVGVVGAIGAAALLAKKGR
jgi:hypothetical protein